MCVMPALFHQPITRHRPPHVWLSSLRQPRETSEMELCAIDQSTDRSRGLVSPPGSCDVAGHVTVISLLTARAGQGSFPPIPCPHAWVTSQVYVTGRHSNGLQMTTLCTRRQRRVRDTSSFVDTSRSKSVKRTCRRINE